MARLGSRYRLMGAYFANFLNSANTHRARGYRFRLCVILSEAQAESNSPVSDKRTAGSKHPEGVLGIVYSFDVIVVIRLYRVRIVPY